MPPVSGRTLRTLLRPGIRLMVFIIGGAYISGAEVAIFSSTYGSVGWLSVATILLGFAGVTSLVFEYARVRNTTSYRMLINDVLGRLSVVFDLLYVVTVIYLLSVVMSVAGAVLRAGVCRTLPCSSILPLRFRLTFVVVPLAVVVYLGAADERGTYGLLDWFLNRVGYLVLAAVVGFSLLVFLERYSQIVGTFTPVERAVPSSAGAQRVVWQGIVYLGIHLPAYPLIIHHLFESRDGQQQHLFDSGKQSLVSGCLAGVVMTLPFFLTYLVQMGYYPQPRIIEAEIPWLPIVANVADPLAVWAYVLVVASAFTATTVGLTQTLTLRLSETVGRISVGPFAGRNGMSGRERALVLTVLLFVAVALSKYGVRNLIAIGYVMFTLVYLVAFALPLGVGAVRHIYGGHRDGSDRVDD